MNKIYKTISGDKWDTIAFKTLGDCKKMDLLIKSNIKYKDVFIFSAGVEIKIPEMPPKENYTLPPWKRGGSQ